MVHYEAEAEVGREADEAPLDQDDEARFVHLRDGYVASDTGRPFECHDDDEADEEVCATLRRVDPGWVRRRMTEREMIEYERVRFGWP